MSSKNIAVIGGSGFIGTRLIPLLLEEGHEVRIVDKNDSAAYPHLRVSGDVRQTSDIVAACKGCDVIYNLAAEHADNVRPLSLYDDVNVQGARNVCDAAEQLGINQIIFTSSVAIYGFSPEELDEDAATNYINDYGRTKLEAEQVYLEWVAKRPDRTLRMIRPTAVFGEGNRGNIYNLIRQLGTKGFVMVGDGENRKSIAYVGNVAAFLTYLLTVNGEQVKIYNYVDKPDLRMNELVPLVRKAFGFGDSMPLKLPYWFVYGMAAVLDMLAALLNRTFPVSRVRIKKFCANSQFATKRLQSSGFEPKFELRDALLRTIRAEFDLAAADNDISG